ncbi:hypothetical protein THAOC_22564 [Thalassiosira oceanica]|uniref:Bromo domain-containing protein n=1 Tax=Thalassiosira oceanica TaxID=159749 RepID=K0RY34_THAOC|nr:hypothetical protein THAOC_22564 [Thalassiosira oceanica]|eukprot:EJK57394.1 hypothetical protein THAOC_22564 [Thalassiosira oceanica]
MGGMPRRPGLPRETADPDPRQRWGGRRRRIEGDFEKTARTRPSEAAARAEPKVEWDLIEGQLETFGGGITGARLAINVQAEGPPVEDWRSRHRTTSRAPAEDRGVSQSSCRRSSVARPGSGPRSSTGTTTRGRSSRARTTPTSPGAPGAPSAPSAVRTCRTTTARRSGARRVPAPSTGGASGPRFVVVRTLRMRAGLARECRGGHRPDRRRRDRRPDREGVRQVRGGLAHWTRSAYRMLSDALAIVQLTRSAYRDYLKIVRRPMDYGTITRNPINGQYTPQEAQEEPGSTNDGTAAPTTMSPLESILLQVLSDVEQVHHNRKGSNYGRAGEVHGRKWWAYLDRHLSGRLPAAVADALGRRRSALDDEARGRRTRPGSFSISLTAARQGSRVTVAVLDPDAKVIVKQYSSQTSATNAVRLLRRLGYECEAPVGSDHAGRARIKAAEDPGSLLFGYQWIPLDHLKSGKFRVKSWEESGADVSLQAAAGTHVISKVDAISGVRQVSFDSEEAAFDDWRSERSVSCLADLGEESQSEFVSNYLDGRKSINGIVWNRVSLDSSLGVDGNGSGDADGRVQGKEEEKGAIDQGG